MAGFDDHRTFIYRIDAENKVIFLNQEWIDFAKENEAPELTPEYVLGQPLDRFIVGWETKHLYNLIYKSLRHGRREVRIPFSCDSPTLRRSFQMRLAPLDRGILEFTVEVIRIEPVPPQPILDNQLEHSSEVVVICSWCKRIRVNNSRWVEIANAVEKKKLFGATLPSLTHDVCPDCFSAISRQIEDR
jgi:hypothetical protein